MTSTSSISIGYPSMYFILNSSITPFVTYVTYVTPFVTYVTPIVSYVTYVTPIVTYVIYITPIVTMKLLRSLSSLFTTSIIFLFIARKTSCSINSGSLHLVLETHKKTQEKTKSERVKSKREFLLVEGRCSFLWSFGLNSCPEFLSYTL